MADSTTDRNSPEYVALKMAELILTKIEGHNNFYDVTREEYLDTYAECLRAVRGQRVAKD